MAEYPIRLEVDYEESASRLEALIIRCVYGFILCIVAGIWGFVAYIVIGIQWLHILILGKRNEGMHNFVTSFFRFNTRVSGYLLLLTDARPPISGE